MTNEELSRLNECLEIAYKIVDNEVSKVSITSHELTRLANIRDSILKCNLEIVDYFMKHN